MKKYCLAFGLIVSFFVQPVSAFRDVPTRSKIYEPLQSFIEAGVLKDGSFFRPNQAVPAQMFFDMILRNEEIEYRMPEEQDILPLNISAQDKLAPMVLAAADYGLLNREESFDPMKTFSKLEAIKILITLKRIAPARRVSPLFSEKYIQYLPKNVQRSIDARYVEAALASNIITVQDLRSIDDILTRQEFVLWLTGMNSGTMKSRLIKDNSFIPEKKFTIKIDGVEQTEADIAERRAKNTVGKFSETFRFPEEDYFERIYQDMLEQYRFDEELTLEKKQELINAAIRGMVEHLDDKYSTYVEPTRANEFLEQIVGSFEGIGAYVEMVDGVFTITAPIAGSPAEKAGIRGGDVVTAVNGESIAGKTIKESIALIKGPAGTKVTLTISRKTEKIEIDVIRNQVDIPAVEFEMINSVPVIRIKNFDQTLTEKFREIIQKEVVGKSRKGLILDVRNDPGGFLTGAVEMCEFFAKKGETLFSTDYRQENIPFKSNIDGPLENQPNIIVLQNEGSASASEIFSSFLQETKRAEVWGTVSRGKGTVQKLLKYSNGGVLKITVAKWLTPSGVWINDDGVIPDVAHEPRTAEQINAKQDPLLDKAVREILNR